MRPNTIKPINKCLNHSLVIQSHFCPISINNKLYEEQYLSVLQICVLGQSLTCVPRQAKQSLSNSDIPFTFVLLSAPNKPTFVIFSAHKIQTNLFLNIAKGTTDPRVEFISQVLTQIFKFQFQILNYKTLTSKSQPNISIST